MTIQMWTSFFGWSLIINWAVFFLWVAILKLAPDFVYKAHSYWAPVKREVFNSIHYGGMGLYKLMIFFFNVVPYFALLLINQ